MNQVLGEERLASGQVIQFVLGDITTETVDGIVNAANTFLQHGGGVAGVISHRGGSAIQSESNTWVQNHGPVSHRQPAYTSAGNLPCRYVIHSVGPIWDSGGEEEKLSEAVWGALKCADELQLISLSMPAISTGTFGFPKELAAKIITTPSVTTTKQTLLHR